MNEQLSCGMTRAEIAAEAAEAERETAAIEAQCKAEREARIAALPTKDQRYFQRNKVRRTYESAMVRAESLKAVPAWLTDEQKQQIFKIYEDAEKLHMATGIPHEVDHIIQLVGKNKAGDRVVCGLHVPSNLRAIPWSLNRRRGDWFYIAAAEREQPDSCDVFGFEVDDGDDHVPF